jgi:cytochrome c-type biogenesis protein CcmH
MSRTMQRLGRTILLLLALSLSGGTPVHAVQPDEMLSDPTLEGRARALSRELRCMVCQNQSIDDSDAPLARDLRILVRERLKAGDSDQQVLDFLTARYGDFVLLKPRFTPETMLLWLVPALVLFGGAAALFLRARRKPGSPAPAGPAPLSAAEKARLSQLTGGAEN